MSDIVDELRVLADALEAGEATATVEVFIHSEDVQPFGLGGMVTDKIYLGQSVVIHSGIATNAMLKERL